MRTSVLTHKQFNNTYHQQKEKIKKLYKSRSKYVHEGKSVEENELNEIVEIVDEIFKCLMRLQNNKDAKEIAIRIPEWIHKNSFNVEGSKAFRINGEYLEISNLCKDFKIVLIFHI